jgi:hypothetical protein
LAKSLVLNTRLLLMINCTTKLYSQSSHRTARGALYRNRPGIDADKKIAPKFRCYFRPGGGAGDRRGLRAWTRRTCGWRDPCCAAAGHRAVPGPR